MIFTCIRGMNNHKIYERHEQKKPQMNTDGHGLDGTTEYPEEGFNGLFEQPQRAIQRQAARSVDVDLVVL